MISCTASSSHRRPRAIHRPPPPSSTSASRTASTRSPPSLPQAPAGRRRPPQLLPHLHQTPRRSRKPSLPSTSPPRNTRRLHAPTVRRWVDPVLAAQDISLVVPVADPDDSTGVGYNSDNSFHGDSVLAVSRPLVGTPDIFESPAVVFLTRAGIENLLCLANCAEPWLVVLYAPWCRFC